MHVLAFYLAKRIIYCTESVTILSMLMATASFQLIALAAAPIRMIHTNDVDGIAMGMFFILVSNITVRGVALGHIKGITN